MMTPQTDRRWTPLRTARFTAFDTWFFREARPHSSAGAPFLTSHFPPPARTSAGALRTWIGDRLGVDWSAFGAAEGGPVIGTSGVDIREWIGCGDGLGQIAFDGPWPVVDLHGPLPRRLYPVPRLLVRADRSGPLGRLVVGEAVSTDLGTLRLPQLPAEAPRRAGVQDGAVDRHAYEAILRGECPAADALIDVELALVEREPRIGLALDSTTHTAQDQMLFQTEHARLRRGAGVEVDLRLREPLGDEPPRGLEQIEALFGESSTIRLGGEGRLAGLDWLDGAATLPAAPRAREDTVGLLWVALTPLDLREPWPFSNLRATLAQRAGVEVEVVSASIGSGQAEGGWDLVRRAPRPVRRFIAAGSIFYTRLRQLGRVLTGTELQEAIERWHGTRVGWQQDFGRGLLAVGLWSRHEDLGRETKTPGTTTMTSHRSTRETEE